MSRRCKSSRLTACQDTRRRRAHDSDLPPPLDGTAPPSDWERLAPGAWTSPSRSGSKPKRIGHLASHTTPAVPIPQARARSVIRDGRVRAAYAE